MRAYYFFITLFLSMLLCTACGTAQSDKAVADSRGTLVTADALQELNKKNWRLIKMVKAGQEISLVQDSDITFSCDGEGTVAGLASINRYAGSLSISDTGEITWSGRSFRMTRKAGPPELMKQEGVFINSLRQTHRMYVKAAQLILESNDETVVLEFVKINN